jgi:hypothetical protein
VVSLSIGRNLLSGGGDLLKDGAEKQTPKRKGLEPNGKNPLSKDYGTFFTGIRREMDPVHPVNRTLQKDVRHLYQAGFITAQPTEERRRISTADVRTTHERQKKGSILHLMDSPSLEVYPC